MLDALTVVSPAVPLALAGTSFALGARHGLDWDHIAAITDLTAPRKDDAEIRRAGRRGLGLSFWYCTGHGLVLAVLGGLVLALGVGLPAGMDVAFEHLVGITLVSLGGVVLYQLGRYRSDYQYTGRISLVVGALRRGWARARRREVPGGVLGSRRAPHLQLALGAVTGVASLSLGVLILTGHGGVVPPLAG